MRKPSILVSDPNQPVQSQKQAKGLKFQTEQEVGLYYLCSEKQKTLISCAQLICVFVFTYADCLFSDVVTHIHSYFRLFSDVVLPSTDKPVLKIPSKLKEALRHSKEEFERRLKEEQKQVRIEITFLHT